MKFLIWSLFKKSELFQPTIKKSISMLKSMKHFNAKISLLGQIKFSGVCNCFERITWNFSCPKGKMNRVQNAAFWIVNLIIFDEKHVLHLHSMLRCKYVLYNFLVFDNCCNKVWYYNDCSYLIPESPKVFMYVMFYLTSEFDSFVFVMRKCFER